MERVPSRHVPDDCPKNVLSLLDAVDLDAVESSLLASDRQVTRARRVSNNSWCEGRRKSKKDPGHWWANLSQRLSSTVDENDVLVVSMPWPSAFMSTTLTTPPMLKVMSRTVLAPTVTRTFS